MKKNLDEALNILLDHQEKEMSHSYRIQKGRGRNKWLKDKGMTKEIVPANELFENILK